MAVTTQEPVDLDALQTDAETRLAELLDQRQRLALDALTDAGVAAELRDVESEIAAAREALERVELARVENARREEEAQTAEQAEYRRECLDRARELQAERERAARSVDSGFTKAAHALRDWDRIATQQWQLLRSAGEEHPAIAARPRSWVVEEALRHALIEAKLPHGIINFGAPARTQRPQSMSKNDPRPVEAKRSK